MNFITKYKYFIIYFSLILDGDGAATDGATGTTEDTIGPQETKERTEKESGRNDPDGENW